MTGIHRVRHHKDIKSNIGAVQLSPRPLFYTNVWYMLAWVMHVRKSNYSYNWLSVTSDYDCILAMLLGLRKNDRLEVNWFSVPTISGTVSVIRRDALRNTSGLTAPDSINTCPLCEGQRWIFNVPTILVWYTWGPPSLRLDPKNSAILGLKACWRLFVSWDSTRRPHNWQFKPFLTAPPWHLVLCKVNV